MSNLPKWGWRGKILKDGTEIGFVERVTLDINPNIQPFAGVGHLEPEAFEYGRPEFTGTIERMWVDKDFIQYLSPNDKEPADFLASGFELTLHSKGGDASQPYIVLKKCYVLRGRVEIPADGWITNPVDFQAWELHVYP